MVRLETAEIGIGPDGIVTEAPLRIYAGLLGQIGDIIMFSSTLRRLRQLYPNARITLAVSRKYQQAGELLTGLPYVNRLFVTEFYFERLRPELFQPWERGWPVDLRGDDEVAEERRHDLVLETRPRHRRERWWEHAHQVQEIAHMVGVPGPIDLRTEIAIPGDTSVPDGVAGKIVFHNEPAIDATKAWPLGHALRLMEVFGHKLVLLGSAPPAEDPVGAHAQDIGVVDLRGRTTLAEAAAIIRACGVYVGIDSGLMWIASSLQVPVIGLYGTSYIPAYGAIRPVNPNARYLQTAGGLGGISVQHVLIAISESAVGD